MGPYCLCQLVNPLLLSGHDDAGPGVEACDLEVGFGYLFANGSLSLFFELDHQHAVRDSRVLLHQLSSQVN